MSLDQWFDLRLDWDAGAVDNEGGYDADPRDSAFKTPNFIYPDQSGFHYDTQPRYVLSAWGVMDVGGIYDVPYLNTMPYHDRYTYCGWTNWADKWMKDYRFSSQSDMNARATLFPEVTDPWMFTEYLFQGKRALNEFDPQWSDPSGVLPSPIDPISIVEPPLFSPLGIDRVFEEDGPGVIVPRIVSSTVTTLNDQAPTVVPEADNIVYELESQWSSDSTTRLYWESELVAMHWIERLDDGTENRLFTKTDVQRRVVKFVHPTMNSGVRLYRRPVWAQATRWGQSNNIPSRALALTGPPSFMSPDGVFTGRIIPHVKITWGIPLYDPIEDTEEKPNHVVKYHNYGATATGQIGVFPRELTGPDGDPFGVFTYDLAPADGYVGALQVQMPRQNNVTIEWQDPNYATNDLVHRGCTFWKGSNGQARCTYAEQYAGSMSNLKDETFEYTDTDLEFDQYTAGFDPGVYQAVIFVSTANHPNEVDVTTLGGVITVIRSGAAATGFTLRNGSGNKYKPASTTAGFYTDPGAWAKLRVIVRRQQAPVPNKKMCAYYKAPPDDNTNPNYSKEQYKNAGGACGFYTPQGIRVLAAYQAVALNGAEWFNLQRGLPSNYRPNPYQSSFGQTMMDFGAGNPLGLGVVQGIAFGLAGTNFNIDPTTGQDTFTRGFEHNDYQRVEVTYEPEVTTLTGKGTYYDTPNRQPRGRDPSSDIKIDASTGFYPIDQHATTPFDAVDTTFFGMVSQNNYRIMHSVMHCYRADKCTKIIKAPGGNTGWRRGWYGGVNFEAHPLRMPGYPAGDGKDENGDLKHCFTGNSRCPYQNLDRRAVEYDENYKILLTEVLRPFRSYGVDYFKNAYSLEEKFILPDGSVVDILPEDFQDTADGKAVCVAVAPWASGRIDHVIGHWQPVISGPSGEQLRAYFYYEYPSWDPLHQNSRIAAHLIQFDDADRPVYTGVPWPSGHDKYDAWYALYGASGNKIPWIVMLDDDYRSPIGNLIHATNNKPFYGGRPPEYKDRSKMKHQIVVNRDSGVDENGLRGITASNQFGGPTWNVAPTTGRVRWGYWIDKDGEWILDGRKIGWAQGFVRPKDRMRNKPTIMGDRHPLDGEPSVTIEDQEFPSMNRSNDFALTGWTYSNDTKAWLDYMVDSGLWYSELPDNPDAATDPTGETPAKIFIAPPSPEMTMLPRERFWFQCTECGMDFPEEEVNFLNDLTDSSTGDKLYPAPSGVEDAVICCPRHDGGGVIPKGPYAKFMNCYSRGHADVWGPPGTTVRQDGYFWRQPTLVSRAHKDLLLRKLGSFHPTGGGYSFSSLTADVEQAGRLPTSTAKPYVAGLLRQLTVPWASPNQKLLEVKQRYEQDLAIPASGVALVQRLGQPEPILVEEPNYGTFNLERGDIISFWGYYSDGLPYRAGLSIGVQEGLPSSITNSDIVLNDTAKPVRSDYGNTDTEERRFRSALRTWLVNTVYGSMQYYGSSMTAEKNAWKQSIEDMNEDGGLQTDPIVAQSFDPVDGELELDERVLDPYGATLSGGLKMITLREVKRLRNRILPALAYDLNGNRYVAGGDFTNRAQAAHLDRYRETDKPMPFSTPGRIMPQVLAATTNGLENYAEWPVGDLANTKGRAYYPTGKTWWRLNQLVGCIKRDGGKNWFHLDSDEAGTLADGWAQYTGDNVKSTVAYFLHGNLPMDKEILAAYLVFTPEDAPSMDAIGCQGQYTGMVGIQTPLSDPIFDEYRGHQYCFWQHYHGYTTNHERDIPRAASLGYHFAGPQAKNHVEIGHKDYTYFLGRQTLDPPLTFNILSEDAGVYESKLQARSLNMEYSPFLAGGADNYKKHLKIFGWSYVDESYGWDVEQVTAASGTRWISPWQYGQDIAQEITEHEIWRELSFAEYANLRKIYHVNYRASVNQNEVVLTGEYYGSYFRNFVWPREQQPISNWVNFSSYNTSNRFSKYVKVEDQIFDSSWADGPQVIVQAGPSTNNTLNLSVTEVVGGGGGPQQAGSVEKVVDITKVIQRLYNDRVDRYYNVKLGSAYADLYNLANDVTDTNEGKSVPKNDTEIPENLAERLHNGYDDPWYFWNYRYVLKQGTNKYGVWLNDPWHHTPTVNGSPIAADLDGDPIQQTEEDRKARVESVSDWDTQGLSQGDAGYMDFHPIQLLGVDIPLTEALPLYPDMDILTTPVPSGDVAGYWRSIDTRANAQNFIMDLRQTPIETSRRSWRNKPPMTDSTNATCPNTSCFVHQNGWTVGQFLENASTGWGFGVIPSESSEYCANCGTALVGVQRVPGDGITTVTYDKPFEPDAIISAVEVSSDHPDHKPDVHHGFIVDYYNSASQRWRTLFEVAYSVADAKWSYRQWNGTAWEVHQSVDLPEIFKGCEGVNGSPKDRSASNGCHFVSPAASKIRYRVPRPVQIDNVVPDSFGTVTSVNADQREVVVPTLSEDPVDYIGKTLVLRNVSGPTPVDKKHSILSVTGTGPYTISVQGELDPTFNKYQIQWTEYLARCTKFHVYGYPFKSGEVVITPPGSIQVVPIVEGVVEFRLNDWPSQISQVTCQTGEGEDVILVEKDSIQDPDFVWTTVEDRIGQTSFLKLTGGAWYYDNRSNSIRIPQYYRDVRDGKLKALFSLNTDLYTDPNSTFTLKTLPGSIMVEYITGNGVSVDVTAEACGIGPSYQLDPESITVIVNNTPGESMTAPTGFTSGTLPTIGKSVKLRTDNDQRHDLSWIVYNHKPMIWPESVGYMIGDELPQQAWGTGIWDTLTGNGSLISEIKADRGARIGGTASGKVTLYGSPSTILSGNLVVAAKAITRRTYTTPKGTVTMSERTGGYREGGFIFNLEVSDRVQGRRTGITAGVPLILVYLRERYEDQDPKPLS